jgi:hypothetical protein
MSVSKLVPSETRILQAYDGACVTVGKSWGSLAATISGIEFMPVLDDDGFLRLDMAAAYELAGMLMRYAYHVGQAEAAARGDNRVLVTSKGGAVWVTWMRRTELMRLSKLRRARECTHCKEKRMTLWVSVSMHTNGTSGSRLYHAKVCEPCVEALSTAMSGLWAVGA